MDDEKEELVEREKVNYRLSNYRYILIFINKNHKNKEQVNNNKKMEKENLNKDERKLLR